MAAAVDPPWWRSHCREIADRMNMFLSEDELHLTPKHIEVVFMLYESEAEKAGMVIVPRKKVYLDIPIPRVGYRIKSRFAPRRKS